MLSHVCSQRGMMWLTAEQGCRDELKQILTPSRLIQGV